MTCVCGIDERTCMREQQRAQSNEPCADRLAARIEEEGFHCAWCGEPTLHEDGFSPDEADGDLICEACNDENERNIAAAPAAQGAQP